MMGFTSFNSSYSIYSIMYPASGWLDH